ncbi:hypothetical protein [Lutibaculum baratangense]|uniref:Lipoprotein n=1 Tax=Lutibaculum baratangense AMV1 TaxID=631454 RepID=V4RWG0_9HYPH|nr:hypothetical protein [Lutibaculum baratangense]ESR27350.1 hypothetical protein N177_0329 [Lutibaculum baratangense AMV1]
MNGKIAWRNMSLIPLLVLLAVLGGCDEPEGQYLEIDGGGFVFNYRIAEAHYGLVAEAVRELPAGSRVRATFENPSGGDPFLIERPAAGLRKFVFDTPRVTGVEKDRPYLAVLEILNDGAVIERHERSFRSNVGQEALPGAPLTVGPGYARNPEAEKAQVSQ